MDVDLSLVRVGATYRKTGQAAREHLWHVRAVVDGDQVVVRAWSRRRRRWLYQVEWVGSVAEWIRQSKAGE